MRGLASLWFNIQTSTIIVKWTKRSKGAHSSPSAFLFLSGRTLVHSAKHMEYVLSTKHYKQHMIQVYNNISSFINESINHLGLRQRMYSNLKAGIGKDCWESKIFKVYSIFTELFLIKSRLLKLLQHSFCVICMCCGLDYNSWLSLIIVPLHIPKP